METHKESVTSNTKLFCELETSLLMRGIQIGEMSKLGWLIGLVEHAPPPNRSSFRNVVFLLPKHQTMEKVQKRSNSIYYTPSSESYKIYLYCSYRIVISVMSVY
jgi:hypothetical protein